MPTRYAVVVKAISKQPWTESVEDTLEDAWEKRQFLEASMRGILVSIENIEWKEAENGTRADT